MAITTGELQVIYDRQWQTEFNRAIVYPGLCNRDHQSAIRRGLHGQDSQRRHGAHPRHSRGCGGLGDGSACGYQLSGLHAGIRRKKTR